MLPDELSAFTPWRRWDWASRVAVPGAAGSLRGPGTPSGLDLPGTLMGLGPHEGLWVPVGSSSGVLLGAAADTALTCRIPVPCRGKESRRTTMTLQEPGEEAPAAAGDFQNAVICCLCKSATPINLGGLGGRGGEVLGRWAAGRARGG